MKKSPVEHDEPEMEPPPSHARSAGRAPTRGVLHGVTPEGEVLVTWRSGEPRRADVATSISDRALLRAIETRAAVLLDFIDGDVDQPVVLALLRTRLDVEARDATEVTEPRLEFVAGEALLLRCGESAIELRQDGHVVIRGAELRSVATGGNTIQGAHVDIN